LACILACILEVEEARGAEGLGCVECASACCAEEVTHGRP
ncbi:MAG: hypothetical protein RL136_2524, partial [Planctomycetota bacterium]